MKIILAGSPAIAVPTFEKVIQNFDVVAIITQPDRPRGRGLKPAATPVADLGQKHKIQVFKPDKISTLKMTLAALEYDLLLTFAFGQYIPTTILKQGHFKPLNIHGSLLPKYRGAAPIHAAILNGDAEIGITLMEMIQAMDAGDMYFQAATKITPDTSTAEAFKIVEQLAAANIVNWLQKYFAHQVQPQPQGQSFSTCGKITKEFAELKADLTITQAMRKVRGLNNLPGAFIWLDQKRLKVFEVSLKPVPQAIKLTFSDGALYAIDYQWAGKKRFKVAA